MTTWLEVRGVHIDSMRLGLHLGKFSFLLNVAKKIV